MLTVMQVAESKSVAQGTHCVDLRHRKASKHVRHKIVDTSGIAVGFGGLCLDNKRGYVSPTHQLEELHPEWINTGCVADEAHLTIKDFCKFEKTKGRSSTMWGVSWLAAVVQSSNLCANYIQDSCAGKSLLQQHQREIYGRVRAGPVNVPTCFGTSFFVMEGVQRTKAAIIQAVSSSQWDSLAGKYAEVLCCPQLYTKPSEGCSSTP
jgi:hypothetical protein